MQLPTYEAQNRWIGDYVYPIVDGFNIAEVVRNYGHRKRNALRRDMEEAGVFESLEKLETQGNSWDGIIKDIKEKIDRGLATYTDDNPNNLVPGLIKASSGKAYLCLKLLDEAIIQNNVLTGNPDQYPSAVRLIRCLAYSKPSKVDLGDN